MAKDVGFFVEGEPGPKFRVYVNDQMLGGFDTIEGARGWVASRRQDQNVEIWEGNKRVFGRDLKDYPPRPGEKRQRR
jgi:hypothetical protein